MTQPTTSNGQLVLCGQHLDKRFGTTTALTQASIGLTAADTVAVMGPSGSGKSTLLHCLAGIVRPDAGEVTLLGERIDNLRERRRSELRRTRFGFVFQFAQLLPELSAEENVALPLLLGGTPRQRAVEQARTWLGPLGIASMGNRRPGELSGGEAQRVALARALVGQPSVVFADEPTGALDKATSQHTMQLLVEATRSQGASLVVVTHDPGVAAWCDRTVEVRDGCLSCTPAEHMAGRPVTQAVGQAAGQVAEQVSVEGSR